MCGCRGVGGCARGPGVVVHRTRHLPDTEIVHRPDGIDITSPPRTAFDAASVLDLDDLESLVEHGIDLGLPDDSFFVEVDHLGWHGRRRRSADDRRRDLKARASGYHIDGSATSLSTRICAPRWRTSGSSGHG